MTSNSSTPNPLVEPVETVNVLADKNADSTDSEIRYMAYGARLRTALRAGTRYIAYTSDIGEAFRPVVPPSVVTAAYAISWLYLTGDVAFEVHKAQRRGPSALEATAIREGKIHENTRLALVAVERATFQSIASMALPALTIHTAVNQAKKVFARESMKNLNPKVRAWGPTLTGLSIVPTLPYLFDHPVEQATERVFGGLKEWAFQIPLDHEKKVV